ncbi:MAG: hypothetical protein PUK03_06880 [Bacteroidales bacterium]|nr:hypothetical protein [Bacteroidales bacterium]
MRFNNLVNQFENNNKYMPYKKDSQTLSDNEDISYEISANDKQYAAIFYQYSKDAPEFSDTLEYRERYAKELKQIEEYLSQFTEEQLENPTEEMEENSKKILDWSVQSKIEMITDLLYRKVVWFTIGEEYGEYYITMFYENGYNEADGSDL